MRLSAIQMNSNVARWLNGLVASMLFFFAIFILMANHREPMNNKQPWLPMGKLAKITT